MDNNSTRFKYCNLFKKEWKTMLEKSKYWLPAFFPFLTMLFDTFQAGCEDQDCVVKGYKVKYQPRLRTDMTSKWCADYK